MASRRLAGAVGAALLGVVAMACNTAKPSGPPTSQAVAVSTDNCATLIRAVDLSKDETVLAVDQCRFTKAGAEASKAALTADVTGDALWAAIWVYLDSGSDPAPLRRHMTVGTATTKAMASVGLVAFGDPSGFAGIREALALDEPVDGSTPPMSIGDLALEALGRYVDIDDPPADATAWVDWLAANSATLVFDDDDGAWSIP